MGDCVAEAVTVLHLSDLQFGDQHLFGRDGLTTADQAYDTLVSRLIDDLAALDRDSGLRPDLVVVTGSQDNVRRAYSSGTPALRAARTSS